MKIDQEIKDFLNANRNLINTFDFTSLYELANSKGLWDAAPQMTYIFYSAGIDPLQYMNFVPNQFADELTLPNSVVSIPDNIEHIYSFAFRRTNATKFIAPANLKPIPSFRTGSLLQDSYAFSNCDDLVEADFSKCQLYDEIEAWMFAYCSKLKVIKFPKNLCMIRSNAFLRCKSLNSIDLRDYPKLTHIEHAAFKGCDNLTTIYLPNSIEHIGLSAFATGKPITIMFDGTQQEWENKFGAEIIEGTWNSSEVNIVFLR